MVNRLHLTGNKLLLYSLIYGFSQTNDCYYSGPLSYITESLGLNKTTVIRLIKELIDDGLIIREEQKINGIVFPRYRTNPNATTGCEMQPSEMQNANQKMQNATQTGCEMQPHNIDDNIYINNKDNNPPLSPKKKNNKIEYAKGVKLLPEEYSRLADEFGEQATKAAIEYLSLYKQEKGYKTKEDNLTIRRWVMEAANKKKTAKPDVWQEAYNYIHSKYDKQPDGNN